MENEDNGQFMGRWATMYFMHPLYTQGLHSDDWRKGANHRGLA